MTLETSLRRFQRYPVQYIGMIHLPKGMRIMSIGFTILQKSRHLVLAGCVPLMLVSPHISDAADAPSIAATSESESVFAPEHIHARLGIVLTLFFAPDSAELTTVSRRALDTIAPQLRAHLAQVGQVVLEGHSDSTGTPEYNLDLSNRRARAVAIYLRDAWDISLLRLRQRAWGDSDLRRSDPPSHAENRRVEIALLAGNDDAKSRLPLPPRAGEHLDLDDFGGATSPLLNSWRIITAPAPISLHR
jgi:outer membrane protein OmpA-like peptidoglycan-associated protein